MWTFNIEVPISDFTVELFERDVNISWTWVIDFIERFLVGWSCLHPYEHTPGGSCQSFYSNLIKWFPLKNGFHNKMVSTIKWFSSIPTICWIRFNSKQYQNLRTKINEKKVEHNCHFGTRFGTGIVEAKHLEEIEKLIPNWGPFKPESAILEYCCASLYGKV